MFTGLIEEIGIVKSVVQSGNGINLTVGAEKILGDVSIGDSISIDGACQTVTKFDRDSFTVFASKVTCEVTTLGSFETGARVNLERAMSASARLGGHFVQGHVDATGEIASVLKDDNGLNIGIKFPDEISGYIVTKGSIAVDGISLTVVSVADNIFSLYLIPETISNTTLVEKKQGNKVNIEVDIIAKYVERMIALRVDNTGEKDQRIKKALMEGGFI